MLGWLWKLGSAIQSLRGAMWLSENYQTVYGWLNRQLSKPTIRRLLVGVTLVFLILFLASCTQSVVTKPEILKLNPPTLLTEPIPEPQLLGDTNEDLLTWALRLLEALRQSNADKAAIREWFNGTP